MVFYRDSLYVGNVAVNLFIKLVQRPTPNLFNKAIFFNQLKKKKKKKSLELRTDKQHWSIGYEDTWIWLYWGISFQKDFNNTWSVGKLELEVSNRKHFEGVQDFPQWNFENVASTKCVCELWIIKNLSRVPYLNNRTNGYS